MNRKLFKLSFLLATMLASVMARAEPSRGATVDLERARALDHEGVRAFREGRYNDAIRYFDGAYKMGAPSDELWNLARCYLKLDQPEEASRELERYLAEPDLRPQDRAEARAQLAELHRRRSTLTITSQPRGAEALVDGRPAGRTPTSIELSPGDHVVVIRRGQAVLHEETVTARFGRAVIVDAQDRYAGGRIEQTPVETAMRFSGKAELGVLWSRLGVITGPPHPVGMLFAGYVLHDGERVSFALGLRASLTDDTWGNSLGAAGATTPCAAPARFEGTALSAFLDGSLGWHVTQRIRIDGDLGLGLGGYFASPVGGDVFVPSCSPAPGVVPAVLVGASASYSFTRAVRAILSPLWFEAQPAFYGARSTPIDASGPWLRLGAGLGVGIDL
jgi:hypothetical protein